MAAVISGEGLGLYNSSLNTLGTNLGQGAQIGRQGNHVYVNASNGNLVVRQRDEFITGLGQDLSLTRTYNSLGILDGDNNDNWRLNVYRSLDLSGVGAPPNVILKTNGDGSHSEFEFNAGLGYYVSTDGDGAHDTIKQQGSNWVWNSGDNTATETYNSAGQLLSVQDGDGNSRSYAYNTSGLITQITDSSGQTVNLVYAGNNLQRIETISAGITQTRVHYGYDSNNRLETVSTDLSPEDNSITDANTFTTTYAYEGASNRITSITHSDGSVVGFTYDTSNRVATVTQGIGPDAKTTRYEYGQTTQQQVLNISNPAVLQDTVVENRVVTHAVDQNQLSLQSYSNQHWSQDFTVDASGLTALPQSMVQQNGGLTVTASGDMGNETIYGQRSYDFNAGVTFRYEFTTQQVGDSAEIWLAIESVDGQRAHNLLIENGNLIAGAHNAAGYLLSETLGLALANTSYVLEFETGPTGSTMYVYEKGTSRAAGYTHHSSSTDYVGGIRAKINARAWAALGTTAISIDNMAEFTQASNAQSYIIQAGDDWHTIANNVYGSSAVAEELRDAMGNPPLTAGHFLSGFPPVLDDAIEEVSLKPDSLTLVHDLNTLWSQDLATNASGLSLISPEISHEPGQLRLLTQPGYGERPALQGDRTYSFADGVTFRYEVTPLQFDTPGLIYIGIRSVDGSRGHRLSFKDGTLEVNYWENGYWRIDTLGTAQLNTRYAIEIETNSSGSTLYVYEHGTSRAAGYSHQISTTDYTGGVRTEMGIYSSTAWAPAETLVHSVSETTGSGEHLLTYTVQANDSWANIAAIAYGNSQVADVLQAAMGNPALTAGTVLSGFPQDLSYGVSQTVAVGVASYYQVQSGDTWAGIAQAVYGTTDQAAIDALQNTMGSPALTVGLQLTVPTALHYSTLTTATVDTTSVVDPMGHITSYEFDAGKLVKVLSPALAQGQRLTTEYVYDEFDNVTRIIDGRGHAVDYSYDSDGLLIKQQDALGNVAEYSYGNYNGTQLLQNKTVYLTPDPDGTGSIQPLDPQITRHVYDAEGNLRFVVSADGSVIENRYDAMGQLTATLSYTQDRFDTSDFLVSETLSLVALEAWAADPARNLSQLERTDFSYDFRGNLSRTTRYTAVLSSGEGDATTASSIHYIYDQAGQLIKTIDPRGVANSNTDFVANNFETHYVYDGLGRITQATDALGNQTSTLHNDAGQRIETTLANGLIRTTIYDALGQVISVSEYNPADLVTPLSETRSVYDDNGRLRAVQDANGVIVHTVYDAAGRMVAAIDASGALTESIYDADGRIVRQIAYANLLSPATLGSLVNLDPGGALLSANTVSLEALRPAAHADDRSDYNFYDEAGRLVFEMDGEGYVTEYVYDGAGQITDTIRHSTAFPGLINNADAAAQVTITDTQTLIQWAHGSLPANNQISTTLIEEETGNAINVDVTVSTDAATGQLTASGTVNTTRLPVQAFDSGNSAPTHSRAVVSDAVSVSTQYTNEVITSGSVNRAAAYQTTASSLNLVVDNQSTATSSNVSINGTNYTVSGIAYVPTVAISWNIQLQKFNPSLGSSGGWENSGNIFTHHSFPSSLTFSDLQPGEYRVRTEHRIMPIDGAPYSSGEWAEWTAFTISLDHVSSITVPSVSGSTSVDFYHRPGNLSGNDGYILDDQNGFVINIGSEFNGQTRDFKVVYRAPDNRVIGIGVGQFTVDTGNETINGFTYYDMQTSSVGTSMDSMLTAAEVGDLGDDLSATLEYVDVSVYLAGTNTLVSSARTYPGVVKTFTGSAKINLSLNTALADGFYDVVVDKFRPGGIAAGTETIENLQIGSSTTHIQDISWPASAHPWSTGNQAVFYYRPQNTANPWPFTALSLTDSTYGLQTYFIQESGEYKVRLHDLNPGLTYEYYIEYLGADEQLLRWSGTENSPHSFLGSSTSTAQTNFSYNRDVSTAGYGTRLYDVFSNEEIPLIDYVSVDVVDTLTNTVVHNDVLTIPGAEEEYLGSLNLTRGSRLADGRYRIEVTRYFKDRTLVPASQFDHFIHEVGLQHVYSLNHSNAVDGNATLDTRWVIADNVVVSNTHSVETLSPTYTTDLTQAYSTTAHPPANMAVINTVSQNSANASQSGNTTTVSGIEFEVPTVYNSWNIYLSKSDGAGGWTHQSTTSVTPSTTSPSSTSFSNLTPGDYRVRTERLTVPSGGMTPVPSGFFGAWSNFTIGGGAQGGEVIVPSIPGAVSVDFYHRPAELSGTGGYILSPDHDFNIHIPPEFDNQFRDFRIEYKNAAGQVIAVSSDTFISGAGTATGETINIYEPVVTSSGTTISGILSSTEVGDFDVDSLGALRYVDATVYQAGTSTVVSTARTYPSVLKLINGINDGRINLSLNSALPTGQYDIVIDKYYNNGASTLAAQTLSNVQIGTQYIHSQDLRWPADVQVISAGDTATFYYRRTGTSAFLELPLSGTAAGDSYFVNDGTNYHVHLDGLIITDRYEYYIEYRDSFGDISKQAGSAGDPHIFDVNTSLNTSVAFTHVEVSSNRVEPAQGTANDDGTRLTNYLTTAEAAATDYLSVDVVDQATGLAIYTDVLTIPRAQVGYDGGLNLSPRMGLLPGSYRIDVTRYFNDTSVAPQLSSFAHDVTVNADENRQLTVETVGDQINFSYGGNLNIASGMEMSLDMSTGEIGLAVQQLAEGPYSYSQRITNTVDASYIEDSGRLAVYRGDTPDIEALRDYYGRTRTVNVTVEQGQDISSRQPELPTGYRYVNSVQGTSPTEIRDPFILTSNSVGRNTSEIRPNGTVALPEIPDADWKRVSIYNSEGLQVYTDQEQPDLSVNPQVWSTSGYSAPDTSVGRINQGVRNEFNVEALGLPAGNYTMRVDILKHDTDVRFYEDNSYSRWYGPGNENRYIVTETYSWDAPSTIEFGVKTIPDAATVSWPSSTQPSGTTAHFIYNVIGGAEVIVPVTSNQVSGQLTATLTGEPDDFYNYRIEYRVGNEVVRSASGTFELRMNTVQPLSHDAETIEIVDVNVIESGASLLSDWHDANQSAIQHIQATVYDAVTGALVSGPVQTTPSTFTSYIGQINLSTDPLASGRYRVHVQLDQTNDGAVNFLPGEDVFIEVGEQSETVRATQLSWDATNRPPNTNVYFRFKGINEADYAPENKWIRATASQSIQGEYYVRFPQTTPNGQQLQSLGEGEYDYVVIYTDRETQTIVESALGRFEVVHENGHQGTHQLNFSRDLDGRHDRVFYNDRGQVAAVINALGYLTENIYDAGGRLVETIRYATSLANNETSVGQATTLDWEQASLEQLRPAASTEDLHTYHRYDAQGRLALEVNAERYVTEYVYGVDGNVSEVINYAERTTAINLVTASKAELRPQVSVDDRATINAYTALGQIESITKRIGSSNMSVVEYEYDAMGQLLKTTNRDLLAVADQRSVSSRYDLQGRVIATLNGEGNQALLDLLAANPAATQAEIDAIWAEHAIHYSYDTAGQQTGVIDQNANRSHFYYDERGNIRYSINALGEVEEMVYNQFGQISHTIQYANRLNAVQISALVGGLLTQETRNTLNSLRDPEHDSVAEQSYDSRGLVVNRSDALGNSTRFEYNAFRELRFERQALQGGATDGLEYRVEHIYDALGQKTNVIAGTTNNDLSQGFDYDAFGRVETSYNYDSNGELYNHIHNDYDRLGRVTDVFEVSASPLSPSKRINGYSYDAFDRKLTQTDASGSVITYSYDDINRSLTIITPEGISTSTKTNAHGESVEVTNGEGQITVFDYDKNGQLLSTQNAENNIVYNEYDAAGRLVKETDANGVAVRIEYDAANRVTSRIVDPTILDELGTVVYQGLNQETKFTYDAKGQVLTVEDPEGVVTETRYDNKGQVVAVIVDPDADDGLDHLALATFYSYDSRGNRLTVSVGREPGVVNTTGESGNLVQEYIKAINSNRYEYDLHGRLILEVVDPTIFWTDADGVEHTVTGVNASTEYRYDAQGNLAVQTNARGFSSFYVHDAFGKLIFTVVESDNGKALVTRNEYNTDDRLVKVTQYAETIDLVANAGTLFAVDDTLVLSELEALVNALDPQGNRVQQQVFDGDDRLIFTISPTGLISESVYDDNNQIIQSIIYSQAVPVADYADVSQVRAALVAATDGQPEQQAWSIYDANGLALYNVDSLGYVTANTFDDNGNLLRTVQYATALPDLSILNDAIANRAQLDTLMPTLADSQRDRVRRYAYDAANRQVYMLDAKGYITESRYDDMGRVTAHIAYADQYTVASETITVNQIAGVLPVEPGVGDRITLTAYDAAGRVVATRDAEGGEELFQYDLAGNRIAYTNAKGYTWHYEYDAANRMIEQRSPEVAVTRLDATVWQQSFDSGLGDISGSLTTSTANYSLDDQRLTLIHSGAGTYDLTGYADTANRDLRFETTLTTGADISQLELTVGAQNSTGTEQHGLLISGGRLYAQGSGGNLVDLGVAEAYTTYIVEVEALANSSTLWVYKAGQNREQGVSDTRSTVSRINQWQAGFTSTAAATGDAAHIDNVRVLLTQNRELMDEGTQLSSHTAHESIITRIEYNALGDVTARTEAAGSSDERRTEYAYDALNRQITVIHPEVGVYNYTDQAVNYVGSRQEAHEILSSRSYFDALGNEVAGIDTAGNVSYKVYDGNSRLIYDIDANGYVTENRYDAFGNVTEIVRYANAITVPVLNEASPGLTVEDLTGPGSPYAIVASASDRVLINHYDLLNRSTETIQPEVSVASLDAAGNATITSATPTVTNEYDAFGNLIKQSTLANGNIWLENYFYYDLKGNQIASVDAEGFLNITEYDSMGNIKREVEYAEPLDLVLNPVSTDNVPIPVPDANGKDRETTYTYDGLNRKLSETLVAVSYSQASVTGAGTDTYDASFTQLTANLTTSYEYDAVGNIVATTDVGGNVSYQFYDALGRLTGETQVSRSEQRLGISLDTTLFVDNRGTAEASLRWSRPPIPGLTAELRVRAVGATSWTPLTVVESANTLEAVIGALPSDQYEYELDYRRVGQTEVYASARGEVNVVTASSTGSLGLVYQVQANGDTLVISGNTTGLTGVLIGGVSYAATSTVNGDYTVDLTTLARGNYSFSTQGASTELSGQIQKVTGALGGDFAIQTTDVNIEYRIAKRARYVVTGQDSGYWQSNRMEIQVPSFERLGTADMQYEVVLEFSNARGSRDERTFTGSVIGQEIVINTPDRLNSTLGYRYHGRLEGVVSIKLWRGDADTVTYTERPNFSAYNSSSTYGYDYTPILDKHYGRRDLVFNAAGGVDTQQLEFVNLPDGSEPGEAETMTAEFSYRLQGSDGEWIRKDLNRIGQGYFSIGNRDIPAGIYEYEIRINGSSQVIQSGQNLAIGNGINGYESVSQSTVTAAASQATNTPLTTYQRDAFGNSVHTTLHANSAVFDSDGHVSVLTDSAKDQQIYTYFDSHGHMVQLQDAEGHSHFYSYDRQGNMAKEWQWVSVESGQGVAGSKLYRGEVYRYDVLGQQTETITLSETMGINIDQGIHNRSYALANEQLTYNAFGEVISRGLNGGAEEYFDYDKAGRLWRTNSGDGIDKIHLYDLQGNSVQTITSQGRDLSQATYDYAQLATTAALSSDIQRNSFFYDKLGRVERQIEPSRIQGTTTFTPDSTLEMDRWGNITRYVDAAGIASEFVYDRFNNRIQQIQAADAGVTIVGENGLDQLAVTPTSYGHYDLYGRMVGRVDANGNEQVMEYDEAGQLTRQMAGDGGIQRHYYNNFGYEVERVAYAGAESSTPFASVKVYDRNGRVIHERMPNGGETDYSYDEAGNRTSIRRLVDIGLNGVRRYETSFYSYDNRGNLIEERLNAHIEEYAADGAVIRDELRSEPIIHRYRYDLQNNRVAEQRYLDFTLSQQKDASWQYDYFGRLTDHIDFGGGDYGYQYNFIGQLTQEDVLRGMETASRVYDYYGDGSLRSLTRGGVVGRYEYDIQGRLVDEYSNDGAMYHNHYDYDALGRLTRMIGTGGSDLIFAGIGGIAGRGYHVDMNYAYDAMGNRRRVHGVEGMNPGYSYTTGAATGNPTTITVDGQTNLETIDQWYTYDAENRVLISRGILQGNQIVVNAGEQVGNTLRDAHGSMEFSYNKLGQRTQAEYYRDSALIIENHYYDEVGNVVLTTENGVGQYTSERTYDLLGRVKMFTAYSAPGTPSEIRESRYNDDGQLSQMLIYGVSPGGQPGNLQVNIRYDHADSYDNDGNLMHYSSEYSSGGGVSDYRYEYDYFESAVASTIIGTNRGANTTTHTYDAFGSLLNVSNSHSDMLDNNIQYGLNAAGQVVHKRIGNHSGNFRHQFYYYANGRAIGTGGHREVDFDYTGTPLSDAAAVSQAPGHYTVRAGDTLQQIALSVYGDAQRWYLIADANGLAGDADLIEGQSLRIPGQVAGARNSSEAFRVFGQGDIIGDTSPQVKTPSIAAPIIYDIPEQKSNGFVVVLSIIVAIIVTIYATYLAKEAWGFTATAAAMTGAAAGNIAGQAVLIAGGEQDGFDWGSLATDVITAGFAAGISQGSTQAAEGTQKAKQAADAAQKAKQASDIAQKVQKAQQALKHVGNAILKNVFNQAVAIATGQQEKFSWSSLAVSAVMAPVSDKINSEIGETAGFEQFGARFTTGFVSGTLSQGMQVILDGGGEVDWRSIAANAFGQALGNSIVGEMKRNTTIDQMHAANRELERGGSDLRHDVNDQSQIESFYHNKDFWVKQTAGLKALNDKSDLASTSAESATKQQENKTRASSDLSSELESVFGDSYFLDYGFDLESSLGLVSDRRYDGPQFASLDEEFTLVEWIRYQKAAAESERKNPDYGRDIYEAIDPITETYQVDVNGDGVLQDVRVVVGEFLLDKNPNATGPRGMLGDREIRSQHVLDDRSGGILDVQSDADIERLALEKQLKDVVSGANEIGSELSSLIVDKRKVSDIFVAGVELEFSLDPAKSIGGGAEEFESLEGWSVTNFKFSLDTEKGFGDKAKGESPFSGSHGIKGNSMNSKGEITINGNDLVNLKYDRFNDYEFKEIAIGPIEVDKDGNAKFSVGKEFKTRLGTVKATGSITVRPEQLVIQTMGVDNVQRIETKNLVIERMGEMMRLNSEATKLRNRIKYLKTQPETMRVPYIKDRSVNVMQRPVLFQTLLRGDSI